MVDYRELLKKYIEHVGDCEGTDFIDEYRFMPRVFSEEEANILWELSNEIYPRK